MKSLSSRSVALSLSAVGVLLAAGCGPDGDVNRIPARPAGNASAVPSTPKSAPGDPIDPAVGGGPPGRHTPGIPSDYPGMEKKGAAVAKDKKEGDKPKDESKAKEEPKPAASAAPAKAG